MKIGWRLPRGRRIGHVPHQFHAPAIQVYRRSRYETGAGCSLLAPCRRPILIATKHMLFRGQDTNLRVRVRFVERLEGESVDIRFG
jgi:hypothetical protein